MGLSVGKLLIGQDAAFLHQDPITYIYGMGLSVGKFLIGQDVVFLHQAPITYIYMEWGLV